jgi:hypothetical protein
LSTQSVSLAAYNTTCTTTSPGYYDSNQPGCIHKVLLTPDNKLLIAFPDVPNGTAPEQGAKLWDGATLYPVQDVTSHLDSGFKLDGTIPVIVEENNSALTSTFTTNPCADQWHSLMVVLESNLTTGDSCLINAIPDFEISYRGGPSNPWVTLSMDDQRSGKSPEWFNSDPNNYVAPVLNSGLCQEDNNNQGYWCLYEDEILQVGIDARNSNSLIYRLAYAYSRSAEWEAGNFGSIPRASGSRDGKYIVFDSTMNFNANGCGNVSNCTDVFWIKIH